MSLRERFLDAIIDGKLGQGIIVTRPQFIQYFKDDPLTYTGVFLSNSEMDTGQHSDYIHFTLRIGKGIYRVHPVALYERMRERGIL
jgi:hypothetical protein